MKKAFNTFFAIFLACALCFSSDSFAEDFPERPITLVIPYTAGGATDRTFRALAQSAKKYFPHSIVVENKPGGSGAVAISSMLGKEADGYTVTVIVPVLQRASYQNKFSFGQKI